MHEMPLREEAAAWGVTFDEERDLEWDSCR
jgi:hypothetical protein